MTRLNVFALLALTLAVPAAAIGGGSLLSGGDTPCFSVGGTGYRLTGKDNADYTIKIDNAAAQPDLTLQMVDDPGMADFVLADGIQNSASCNDARAIRTIRIDLRARDPDLTIALANVVGTAHYKIYAHTAEFTAQDAAALFAVMWKTGRKRDIALR